MEDNAFVRVGDWARAQALSDGFDLKKLHADLNALAQEYVPFLGRFKNGYHWSLRQVEYSWDIVWKKAEELLPVYAEISRQAILTVKAADVAKFLGKRLSAEAEVTSDFGNLDKITGPVKDGRERSWRGFNFFARADVNVLLAILRGEYQISGMSNRLLQRVLPDRNSGQIARILKRLRLHGLIKKVGHTYKYYVTALGQKTLLAGLKIKEHILLPALAAIPAPA